MKKVVYIAIGLCAILASCAKEIDPIPAENLSSEQKTVLPANIPACLTALYAEEESQNAVAAAPKVKTAYDADGRFSWVQDDQVALYFVDNLAAPENQGWISYEASSVNGASATFNVKDGQTDKALALSAYENTGLAIYPVSIARPASDNSESCAYYEAPFVTVRSSVSGNASDIILIGSADANAVFQFKTAMGVLKVTVTGIPSQAAALQLISNDQDSYPLCGDFKLNIGGDLEIKNSDYLKYYSYHTGANRLTVDLSAEGDIASRDFYFNIPIGSYEKGAFSLKLVDGSGNALLEKTLNKKFEFERNDLVDTPALANEWVTLGVGRFVDNFLWAKIVAKGLDKDIPDYVNVTVQQNVADANKFRLVDPYGAAATQFGYVSTNAADRDEYLVFTVAGPEAGSAVTGYTTHRTGFTIDGGNYNPELVYPTTYNSGSSTAQNKVVAGDASLPKIVQFAPAYHYSGKDMTSSYTYPQAFDKKGVLRIMFPDATGYEGSLTPSASATAATLSPLAWTHEANATRIRMVISQYTDYEIAAPQVNSYYCDNYPSGNDAANSASNTNWDASGKVAAAALSTGPAYLTWYTADGSESVIYSQGRTKVYYISSADAQQTVGTFKGNLRYLPKYYSSKWCYISDSGVYDTGNASAHSPAITATDNSFVIAASNNPLKGNIMITNILGLSYDGSSTSESFINSTLISEASNNLSGATYAAGSPVYGNLSGSTLSFVDPSSQDAFVTYNGDPVFFAQNNTAAVTFTKSAATDAGTTTVTLTAGNSNLSLPVTLNAPSVVTGCLIRFQGYTGSTPVFTRSYDAE